jgi:hypothetical protein
VGSQRLTAWAMSRPGKIITEYFPAKKIHIMQLHFYNLTDGRQTSYVTMFDPVTSHGPLTDKRRLEDSSMSREICGQLRHIFTSADVHSDIPPSNHIRRYMAWVKDNVMLQNLSANMANTNKKRSITNSVPIYLEKVGWLVGLFLLFPLGA